MSDVFNARARQVHVAIRTVRDCIPEYVDSLNGYLDAIYERPTSFVEPEVFNRFVDTQMALNNALNDLTDARSQYFYMEE